MVLDLTFAVIFWLGLSASLIRYQRRDPRLRLSLQHWFQKVRRRPKNLIVFTIRKWSIRRLDLWLILVSALVGAYVWLIEAGVWHLNQKWGIGHVLMWQAIASVALVVAVVDGALKRIPNALLIVLAGWAVFAVITQCVQVGLVLHTTGGRPWAGITTVVGEKAMGFALATIAFLMVRMVSKGGLGAGDVKLYALLGFGAGLSGIIALILISLILSAITGVVLMLFRKRTAKDVLPLAPFTFIAVVATVALGF